MKHRAFAAALTAVALAWSGTAFATVTGALNQISVFNPNTCAINNGICVYQWVYNVTFTGDETIQNGTSFAIYDFSSGVPLNFENRTGGSQFTQLTTPLVAGRSPVDAR